MRVIDLSTFPTTIDITVNRYNYIDNKLWTQIKNQIDYIPIDKNSILLSTEQVFSLIETNWVDEINKIKSVGSSFFSTQVNTVYFIYSLLGEMNNLQYIKFTRNFDKQYTRLLNENNEKRIEFDFKVLSMTLRLSDFFSSEELKYINKSLIELKILKPTETYTRLKAMDLLDQIDNYLSNFENLENSTGATYMAEITEMLSFKIEKDNPLILLITDY